MPPEFCRVLAEEPASPGLPAQVSRSTPSWSAWIHKPNASSVKSGCRFITFTCQTIRSESSRSKIVSSPPSAKRTTREPGRWCRDGPHPSLPAMEGLRVRAYRPGRIRAASVVKIVRLGPRARRPNDGGMTHRPERRLRFSNDIGSGEVDVNVIASRCMFGWVGTVDDEPTADYLEERSWDKVLFFIVNVKNRTCCFAGV